MSGVRSNSGWSTTAAATPLLVLAACAALTIGWPAAAQAAKPAWEFDPYRVRVWLVPQAGPELTPHVLEQVRGVVANRVASTIGAPWVTTVEVAPATICWRVPLDWSLLTAELLEAADATTLTADKLILLILRPQPHEIEVEAREFDCRTRNLSAPVRYPCRQIDLLGQSCFQAAVQVFRPSVRIEVGEHKSAVVRVRAGGLVIDDWHPCHIGQDDVLLPILRENDRNGALKRVDVIPWTLLLVASRHELNPNVLTCAVFSSMRSPVQGRVGIRKERYALRVRPTLDSTRVIVQTKAVRRTDPVLPMVGLELYAKKPVIDPPPAPQPAAASEAAAVPETPAADGATAPASPPSDATAKEAAAPEKKEEVALDEAAIAEKKDPPEFLGYTDWRGSAEVRPSDAPLRMVYVKNGGRLLARLPVLPGLDAVLVADISDDAQRLQAEGYVKGLQAMLMDLVANRKIYEARIRMRIDSGKFDEADELLKELMQLPSKSDLEKLVNQQQTLQAASLNKAVQSQIDLMYANFREALGKFVDAGLTDQLRGEIQQARQRGPVNSTARATPSP